MEPEEESSLAQDIESLSWHEDNERESFGTLRKIQEQEKREQERTHPLVDWYHRVFRRPLNLYFSEFVLFFSGAWWGSVLFLRNDLYDVNPTFVYFLDFPIDADVQGFAFILVALCTLIASIQGNLYFRLLMLLSNFAIWAVIIVTVARAGIVPGMGLFVFVCSLSLYAFCRLIIADRQERKLRAQRCYYAKKLREEVLDSSNIIALDEP